MGERLGRVDCRPVHQLHAAWNDAVGNDARHAFARLLDRSKPDQQCARGLRLAQDANRDLGDDREQTLRARQHPEEIVVTGVEMLAANADDFAAHQHSFDAQHVVGRHAVLEAMHATRVLGDVAADRADHLAGWIGRVIEAAGLDGLGNRQVRNARLGDDAAVGVVDVEDAVELGESEEHAVAQRQRATRERSTGATRHDLRAEGRADLQGLGDLPRVLRQHHQKRHLLVRGEAVGLVGAPLVVFAQHRRHDGVQGRRQLVATSNHARIRNRHQHAAQDTKA